MKTVEHEGKKKLQIPENIGNGNKQSNRYKIKSKNKYYLSRTRKIVETNITSVEQEKLSKSILSQQT